MDIEQHHAINIIRKPERGLVMAKARDSVSRAPFYMGEVIVSECTVEIAGVYGLGIVMGEDADKSYDMAVVDAAMQANLVETSQWQDRLMEQKEKLETKRRWQYAQVAKTNVDFATVEEWDAKL